MNRFLIACPVLLFLLTAVVFSWNPTETDLLRVLKNPLASEEERLSALQSLNASEPSPQVVEAMLDVFKNGKESIPFSRRVADALIQVSGGQVRQAVNRLLFDQYGNDLFLRQMSLHILMNVGDEPQKMEFLARLMRLAQDPRESPDLRQFAIKHLSSAHFLPSGQADWAAKIAENKREPVQARTAALDYIEENHPKDLIDILSRVMLNASDDQDFRQVSIMKAARHYSDLLAVPFTSLLFDQKQTFEIRRLCMEIMVGKEQPETAVNLFKQVLAKEKDPKMQTELRQAVDSLKPKE